MRCGLERRDVLTYQWLAEVIGSLYAYPLFDVRFKGLGKHV